MDTKLELLVLAAAIGATAIIGTRLQSPSTLPTQPSSAEHSVCPKCSDVDDPSNDSPLIRYQGTDAELDNSARW